MTILEIVLKFVKDNDIELEEAYFPFYSPEVWEERGEADGTESKLIVVHEGGELAEYCNMDYMKYDLCEKFTAYLGEYGYYIEQCTGWYSAIYEI